MTNDGFAETGSRGLIQYALKEGCGIRDHGSGVGCFVTTNSDKGSQGTNQRSEPLAEKCTSSIVLHDNDEKREKETTPNMFK